MVSPDACDPQPTFLQGSEMLSSAGVCYVAAGFLQKSSKYAAKCACAVDEIRWILAVVHRARLRLVL
ncbi:MAG: hypothetical protein A4E46_01087 [Methanosaeta sp. PtaU1.Bin016]|nr:MAG: hypothetical protein A4E46_01087 [Methanosaeta sp. PtaU1.Bin016]